jgi:glucose-6-phosphate 1-epimerase
MMRRTMQGVQATDVRADDGAQVTVADHGAHLLSWIPAGGSEALYMSGNSGFGGAAAIRGGVPIIFPQFGERGSGKRHGFARTAPWRLSFAGVENGRAVVRHELRDADLPAGAWPHRFVLSFEVAVQGSELRMALKVENPSAETWTFNAALHTYWRIGDIERAGVAGLQGLAYVDQTAGGAEAVQVEERLQIRGEIDRIYAAVASAGGIRIADGKRVFTLGQQGFGDAVVWNPGAEKAAALNDLTPGGHRHFLCVEAGAVLEPVVLGPGDCWTGIQTAQVQPA